MDKYIADKLAKRDERSTMNSVHAFSEIFQLIKQFDIQLSLEQKERLEEALLKFGNTRRLIGEERIDYYVEIHAESALRYLTIHNNPALAVRELLDLRCRGYVFDVPELEKDGGYWVTQEVEASNRNVVRRLEVNEQHSR